MPSHLKMSLNRHRNTTDITNERTSLVTPVPINRGRTQRDIWLNPNASTNLQFARCHFENELRHRADGQASCGGRMDFIPDGVTVHLKHKVTCHFHHSKEGKERTTRFSIYRRIASVVVGGALVRQQLLKLGWGGYLAWVLFQSCSSAAAGRHGEAETHVGRKRDQSCTK